jgi:hypothetical protein
LLHVNLFIFIYFIETVSVGVDLAILCQ